MSSLRKPKTITIRGNDQKDYKYLVKGGEDLRQDQRVEQVFELMNRIFDTDPVCKQRKLQLRTYQVSHAIVFLLFFFWWREWEWRGGCQMLHYII